MRSIRVLLQRRGGGEGKDRLGGWAARWLTEELSALARKGDWEAAIAALSSAGVANTVQVNTFHYTTIISGCAKAGKWEAAMKTFEHMRKNNVAANVYTYTSLISACSAGGRTDLALKVYALMQVSGVPPNLHTLTAVVAACAKDGQWERAISVLNSAEEFLIHPNVITYTAAMDGCRRAGRWKEAMELLERMYTTVDVRPNSITYNTVLNACAVGKAPDAAREVFAAMRAEGFLPIGFTKTCLDQAFEESRFAGSTNEMPLLPKPSVDVPQG